MVRLRLEQAAATCAWLIYRLSGARAGWCFDSDGAPIGLNIGCGDRIADGWINLDRTIHAVIARVPGLPRLLFRLGWLDHERFERYRLGVWRRVRLWDVRYGLPLPDGVLPHVYSSHLIEHLEREACRRLLRECYRVLRPGGVLRLVAPDLFVSASQYVDLVRGLERGEAVPSEVVTYLEQPVLMADLTDRFVSEILEPDPARRAVYGHVWMYDCFSLNRLLREVGFDPVVRCEFRQGSVPDLPVLDVRRENSMHIEARKPG